MLIMLLFLSSSAAITLLIIGIVKSVKKEDAYFVYLSSVLLFCVAIGTVVYMSWRSIMYGDEMTLISTNINLAGMFGTLAIVMLLTGIITGIVSIISVLSKKNATLPGVICGISFSASALCGMIILFITW